MSYVYDLVLNFNNDLYEFYEWKQDDVIYHIKRIHLIKVDSKTYNEIYPTLEGKKGILYLDSGNHFEIKNNNNL